MKKFLALLCMLVFLVGSAMCEEEPQALPEDQEVVEMLLDMITSEEEPIAGEPASEEVPVEEPLPEPIVSNETVEAPQSEMEFSDDDWGEVTITLAREVYISFLEEPEYFGDTVTLVITLVNFKDEDVYTIHWQYCIDVPDWLFLEDEHEHTYSFVLTEENYEYLYRVLVDLHEEE